MENRQLKSHNHHHHHHPRHLGLHPARLSFSTTFKAPIGWVLCPVSPHGGTCIFIYPMEPMAAQSSSVSSAVIVVLMVSEHKMYHRKWKLYDSLYLPTVAATAVVGWAGSPAYKHE